MSEEKKETTLVYNFTLTSKSAIFLFGLVVLLAGACYGFAGQIQPLDKRVKALEARNSVLEAKVAGHHKSLDSILKALQELEPK